MSRPPLRVAVLGAGTVGREVVRGLLEHPERLCAEDGSALVLAGVACRNVAKARDSGIPADLVTDAPARLVASPETDVVVELMGGTEPARTLIVSALAAGTPVVTANKHVVAHHGPDLEAAARGSGVAFRFEAAVAGGIPILGVVASDLAANAVTAIGGIVNGTTNYILSAMTREGRDYREVLADAQALGYAEADPAGDVEGDDAVNKIVILARLAYGTWLDPASVGRRPPTLRGEGRPGIVGVTAAELEAAAGVGLAIKLLATARPAGGGVAAGVLPTAVPADGDFGRTDGVTNRIEIEAEPLGKIGLDGPGAGGAATASAVLGDLVAVARGLGSTWAGRAAATQPALPAEDLLAGPCRWFAFVPAADVADIAGDATPAHGGSVTGPTAVTITALATGLAVQTPAMSLDGAQAAVSPLVRDGRDVTLYPIHG